MVLSFLIAGMLILPAVAGAVEPIGVVYVTRHTGAVAAGSSLFPGTDLDTGRDGWMEVVLFDLGRVRLSAATRLVVDDTSVDGQALELAHGRIWLHRPRTREPHAVREPKIKIANLLCSIFPETDTVLEVTRNGEVSVAVRRGTVAVTGGGMKAVHVQSGEVVSFGEKRNGRIEPQLGGEALAEIVTLEAEHHLGDRIGFWQFVLDHIARGSTHAPAENSLNVAFHGEAEVSGSSHRSGNVLLEMGLRPPPFFAHEVPPKGPNVRVEVDFADP